VRIATALAGAVAALVLSSCGRPGDKEVDGYTWYRADRPAMKSYQWRTVERAAINAACNETDPHVTINACSFWNVGTGECLIVSWKTEEEARRFTPSGPLGRTTLFEHEVASDRDPVGHCNGYDHREAHLRRI
jgi:hypothetical protein